MPNFIVELHGVSRRGGADPRAHGGGGGNTIHFVPEAAGGTRPARAAGVDGGLTGRARRTERERTRRGASGWAGGSG